VNEYAPSAAPSAMAATSATFAVGNASVTEDNPASWRDGRAGGAAQHLARNLSSGVDLAHAGQHQDSGARFRKARKTDRLVRSAGDAEDLQGVGQGLDRFRGQRVFQQERAVRALPDADDHCVTCRLLQVPCNGTKVGFSILDHEDRSSILCDCSGRERSKAPSRGCRPPSTQGSGANFQGSQFRS
jgi:hypothetical protein